MIDEFQTLTSKIGEGTYSEKRSKFLAFSHHVTGVEEIKAIVSEYKKKFYDARHVCYAYVLGSAGTEWRANDDGEPSGTAGKPILGQIQTRNLTNTLVVVIRYFGGILLGTGGLVVAYREAASEALNNSDIIVQKVTEQVHFSFTYPMMNGVMRIVKEMNVKICEQHFDTTCRITLEVRRSEVERLQQKLQELSFQ